MIVISSHSTGHQLERAVAAVRGARLMLALTGAGISVASGIPDFRSGGGLWSLFAPDEFATLEAFYHDPVKCWRLYRALGRTLAGKKPNSAHRALADLEERGLLHGIITQNIDGLHQLAGSRVVLEMHGEHGHLHCLSCGTLEAASNSHFSEETVPNCRSCGFVLKPNVVLFGEPVRMMEEIENLTASCDLLLVVGTSARVYPAAGLVPSVKRRGGIVFEFNREQVLSRPGLAGAAPLADFYFPGDATESLPMLVEALR